MTWKTWKRHSNVFWPWPLLSTILQHSESDIFKASRLAESHIMVKYNTAV
jgi:hypothetical protein